MSSTRILIDLTTSKLYIGENPVGIVRVEREIARRFYETDSRAEFIFFDYTSKCFRTLSRSFAAMILDEDQLPEFEDRYAATQDAGVASQQAVGGPSYGSKVKLHADDLVISAGLAWDTDMMRHIYVMKQAFGFRVVQIIYDIVPIVMPEYCVPGMEIQFPRFVLDVAWTADLVFCISKSTEDDFAKFLSQHKLPMPRLERIFLGNTVDHKGAITDELLDDGSLKSGNFVLYVSTIEPRKNHLMLFNIWRELRKSIEGDLIPLVFVGRKGWSIDNLISYIESCSSLYPEYIRMMHGVSDNKLTWLYQNARFTVYPSMYEGWGLPVVEALSFGKVCLASNTSSMPEAAAGFGDLLAPLDYVAWHDRIRDLIADDDLIKEKEQRIKSGFRAMSWKESMQDFDYKIRRFAGNSMKGETA